MNYSSVKSAKSVLTIWSFVNDIGEWIVQQKRARSRKVSPEEKQARRRARPLEDIALTEEEDGQLCPSCRCVLGKGMRRVREMKEDNVIDVCSCGSVKRRRNR